jgi:hypothetical protein
MVLWSVHGYKSDDREDYFVYSSYNCRRLARRLSIPYAFTVETFANVYHQTNDEFLWGDVIHQSVEGSALFATVIYSLLTGGEGIENWPADWTEIHPYWREKTEKWYSRSVLLHQDVLRAEATATITSQNDFNFGGTVDVLTLARHTVGFSTVAVDYAVFDIRGRKIYKNKATNGAVALRVVKTQKGAGRSIVSHPGLLQER